jgi:hypothetical protein
MLTLFLKFPTEIHTLIIQECLPNDQICLSLTWYIHTPIFPNPPREVTNRSKQQIPPEPGGTLPAATAQPYLCRSGPARLGSQLRRTCLA